MIASKKVSAFAAALPAVYLVSGIILDAKIFSDTVENYSLGLFLELHLGYISNFELLVLVIALVLTLVLVRQTNIHHYQNLLRYSPFINIGIGLLLFINLWFVGIAVAFVSALITALMLYSQRKK